MAFTKRDWILREMGKVQKENDLPDLKEAKPDKNDQPSLQEKLSEETGIWPYLQLWDTRQFRKELERTGGYDEL